MWTARIHQWSRPITDDDDDDGRERKWPKTNSRWVTHLAWRRNISPRKWKGTSVRIGWPEITSRCRSCPALRRRRWPEVSFNRKTINEFIDYKEIIYDAIKWDLYSLMDSSKACVSSVSLRGHDRERWVCEDVYVVEFKLNSNKLMIGWSQMFMLAVTSM